MNEPRPIPAEDLALYALGALSADEMVAVASALRDNPEAQRELALIQGDLALVGLSVEQQQPPAGAFERLKVRMHETATSPARPVAAPSAVPPAAVTTPVPEKPVIEMPRRSKWAIITPWAVAAGLAIATIVLGAKNNDLNEAVNDEAHQIATLSTKASQAQQVLEVLNAGNAQRVTLTSSKTPPSPTAHTIYVPDRGALLMQADNLKPLPAGKTYELWVIPANGSAPVPAGIFAPNAQGYASVVLPKIPTGVAAKAFGITIENAGGATSPTLPIVLAGE